MRAATWLPLVALLAAAQEPLVRVNTRLVEVDVVVRSSAGPVTGLSAADFTVLDKGKPQKLTVFSVRTPESANAAAAPLPEGVVSNRLSPAGEEVAGATVVLFDRLNTDVGDQTEARRQVLQYLATLGDKETIAVYALNKTLSVVQDFTGDPQKLRAAVNKSSGEVSADLTAPLFIEDLPLTGDAVADGMALAAAKEMTDRAIKNRVEITAEALRMVARHLSGVPGRKKLVWITSAFPASYSEQRARLGTTQIEAFQFGDQIEKAARKLNDANVAVYPIDPRNPYDGGFMATGIDTMNLFAGKTGGQAQYVVSDIAAALRKAQHDTDVTYVLGFYPAESALDGSYHSLNVKVARKGVEIRARKGYFAGDNKPVSAKERKTSLEATFLSPLEETGLGLQGSARRVDPGNYELQLRLNVNELHLEPEKGRWVALIAIATEFPPKGHPNGTFEELKITLTEARLKEVLRDGFLIKRPFFAAGLAGPLRVAVQDRNTGELGSLKFAIAE